MPPSPDRSSVTIPDAVTAWIAAWVLGAVLAMLVTAASGAESVTEAGAGWLVAVQVAAWTPMVSAVWWSQRTPFPGPVPAARRVGLVFRPIDLLGVPLGLFTQFVLVRAVYLPLQAVWPDAFHIDRIEEPARTLYDAASGSAGGIVLLVLVVVIGAPIVEELVYRNMLQGAFTDRWGDVQGVAFVAMWFSLIHFQPAGIPGLFVVGLVLGVAAVRTGRLGLPIITHLAFNAAGLFVVSR